MGNVVPTSKELLQGLSVDEVPSSSDSRAFPVHSRRGQGEASVYKTRREDERPHCRRLLEDRQVEAGGADGVICSGIEVESLYICRRQTRVSAGNDVMMGREDVHEVRHKPTAHRHPRRQLSGLRGVRGSLITM